MKNQIEDNTSDPEQQIASETKPYAPSYIDRILQFVERLPVPYWLTYLVLFILEVLILHVVAWVDGWLPAYTFSTLVLLFPIWLWGPLTIMSYLNSLSLGALSTFNPLLEIEEQPLDRLRFEFTTMPGRGVILSGLTWVIVYIILTYLAYEPFYVGYGIGPAMRAVIMFTGLVSFFTGSTIYYHSLRQLKLVSRTVKMVRRFNIYQLDPVYAFSRVTAQTGVSWMIMLSLTLLVFPVQLANIPMLALWALQVVLAIAAFVLPLWVVNRRLVSEKLRLLSEVNRQIESTSELLHGRLDAKEMGELSLLGSAMTGLRHERDVLTSLPTWPWRPGTLTGFLSAIVLPIVLFLVQLIIRNLLGA